MKLILLLACCVAALAGANAFSARKPRDVSQLSTDNTAQIYLPPSVESEAAEPLPAANEEAAEHAADADDVDVAVAKIEEAAAETAENEDNATVLKPEGYVYKTVRTLRFRARRDVSHLSREYLPPFVRTPAKHYLPPPVENVRNALELSNEYLPPVEAETEAPTTEPPTTTTMLPITTTTTTTLPITSTTTEAVTELPTTQALITKELVDDDTAVLAEDGYHYKKPDVVPDLSPVREYLPPVEDSIVVEEESPSNNESAALTEDGYRYRAIRRFRF